MPAVPGTEQVSISKVEDVSEKGGFKPKKAHRIDMSEFEHKKIVVPDLSELKSVKSAEEQALQRDARTTMRKLGLLPKHREHDCD
ncbi:TPA: hypothetical protein DCQ44_03130 [Candidatus Taylorbacteria bacterium]|nr:hypothetical protein [Candidatus Taylorbacteria bacterium]